MFRKASFIVFCCPDPNPDSGVGVVPVVTGVGVAPVKGVGVVPVTGVGDAPGTEVGVGDEATSEPLHVAVWEFLKPALEFIIQSEPLAILRTTSIWPPVKGI